MVAVLDTIGSAVRLSQSTFVLTLLGFALILVNAMHIRQSTSSTRLMRPLIQQYRCQAPISTTRLMASAAGYEDVLDEMANPTQKITWYPGHIAKAERELADYLKKVDVVIEVRDARIPLATTHPMVPKWVGNKPLIIAVGRIDQISRKALRDWREYYAINPPHPDRPDAKVFFIDGKLGSGVLALKKEALKASTEINAKREKRGIQPRAVRAAVIGFPNVGKSALINRLLGRKVAKSRNLPGVTRSLQWIRLKQEAGDQSNVMELLDSPGIIPAKALDQANAMKLAICNDIGEASYDRVVVAGAMCDLVNTLHAKTERHYVNMDRINQRYGFEFNAYNGEEIVWRFAQDRYAGNLVSAADKLLGDFRKNYMGFASLEDGVVEKRGKDGKAGSDVSDDDGSSLGDEEEKPLNLDVGRGNYEGW